MARTILYLKDYHRGGRFGDPHYYDVTTPELKAAILPHVVDWYMRQYGKGHSRTWDEQAVRKDLEESYRQFYKDKPDKLTERVNQEYRYRKNSWDEAEALLTAKDNQDWDKLLELVSGWSWENLSSRTLTAHDEWVEPEWSKPDPDDEDEEGD